MDRTLVTIIGSRHALDLELPADIPAADFMPILLRLCEDLTPEMIDLHRDRWGLGLVGEMPLDPRRTLRDASVLDGARLLLHPLGSWGSSTAPITQLTGPQWTTTQPERPGMSIHWDDAPER